MELEIAGLSKTFAMNGRGAVSVLDNISMDIAHGEFLSIIGPSGCGKTTFIEIIAGLQQQTAGTIRVDGRPRSESGCNCAIVFQQYGLFPWLTVRRNVEYGLKIRGMRRRRRREVSDTFLRMVHLDGYEDYYPHELSGGMQQRVALARSLANSPDILLLDEPFAALDAFTKESCQQELLGLWHGTGLTVVFVTHDVTEAVYLSDRIVVFAGKPGRVLDTIPVDIARPRSMDVRLSDPFRDIERRARAVLAQARTCGEAQAT